MYRNLAVLVAAASLGTPGQVTPAALDVASVIRSEPRTPESALTLTLVQRPNPDIFFDDILGLPDWARAERYNITAKPPESVTHASAPQQAAMLRELLSDRYKMMTHKETRVVPVPLSLFVQIT